MRPSHKELTGKIRQAKDLVSKGAVQILNQMAVAADALELGYDTSDLSALIANILNEIDPNRHYAGERPPQRSYEQDIQGLDLFAFRLFFKPFGTVIYFKFAVSQDQFWLVSLHQHRGGGKP